jgi:hypothetical protein
LAFNKTAVEMAFYLIILYLEANEFRNREFIMSYEDIKMKEKCGMLF